jgi:hypothetical protein
MDAQSINQEGARPIEPDEVLQQLKRGSTGFGPFYGQHAIYIPMRIYEVLGEKRILEIASEAYGADCLKQFAFGQALCRNSFLLELPPVFDRTRKFVVAVREAEKAARGEK